MGALPLPDLPPGPHRDLLLELHDLHHRAGWPSLRVLARDAGVSHTTVSHVFSSTRLPSWGTCELLVEAMRGEKARFHDLWLAATSPRDDGATGARPLIAGRQSELAAVRRHLESGAGLALVTGEAGMGKTTLVDAAAAASDALVVSARCLPLSQQTPLMPVIDVLRALWETDNGEHVDAALDACPAYVAESLATLLPEMGVPAASVTVTDEFARQRLFSAVRALLDALCGSRQVGIVLDDLHWADTSTLAIVDYLTARGTRAAVVGTWRSQDHDTADVHEAWLTRVRRQTAVEVIELGLLGRTDTATQLALVLGRAVAAGRVNAVFGRTLGHPLFTAQLATVDRQDDLPSLLSDLLDARLGDLEGETWAVVRVLGLANRPVPASLLAAVTQLPDPDITRALHALRDRHLLDPKAEDAALTHPLVAEGVRRRLVPGEATRVHAHLAQHMAERDDASPAEVAAHYRAADDQGGELPWRIRAAHEAHGRTAPREEAEHWLRALEMWPPASAAEDGVRLASAQLAAVEALDASGQEPVGLTLARSALDTNPHMDPGERFRLALRAAAITWGQHGPDRALELLDRAESQLGGEPAPDLRMGALRLRAGLLSKTGRVDEALDVLDEAVGASARATDHAGLFRLFATQGWHLGFSGDLEAAGRSFTRAREILGEAPSPDGEVFLAMMHTDVLLHHGRPPTECVEAAERALLHIHQLDLRSTMTNIVRANVGEAWMYAGQPARAAELLLDDVATGDDYSLWPIRHLAARIAVAAGNLEDALTLLRLPSQDDLFARLTAAGITSEALIWLGRADEAGTFLRELLGHTLDNDIATIAGPAFMMLARATADATADAGAVPEEEATAQLHTLRDSARTDPLGPGSMPASRQACTAQWDAETARAAGRDSVEAWVRAVAEWEKLARPHDAAYCRWRAAQAALRDGGQNALAARLLTRAAFDARAHAPLSAAIAGTSASSARPRHG